MKNVWVFFLSVFSALTAIGQTSITEKEKMLILDKRDLFFSHDVSLANYQFDNGQLNEALLSAALTHKKRKTSKIAGGIFLGLGTFWTVYGIVLRPKGNSVGAEIGRGFTNALTTMGVIAMAVSIPFFTSADKRKKEMEKSLQKAKMLTIGQ